MAFIHQILANLEADGQIGHSRTADGRDRGRERIAVPLEVMRFAPKKDRPQLDSCDCERMRRLEAENATWRKRAMDAEARLHRIESTIQVIAAQVRASQFK